MNAEILCIGTELLLGNVVNTNAAWLSQQLARLGINVYHHTVVGDNAQRLEEALQIAFRRSDLVITTGGLGPTYDDLSKETVSKYFNRQLVLHQPSLEKIQEFFAKRPASAMMPNNEKQAYQPEGAVVFTNHSGTAPGAAIEGDGKLAIMLPVSTPRSTIICIRLPAIASGAPSGLNCVSSTSMLASVSLSTLWLKIKSSAWSKVKVKSMSDSLPTMLRQGEICTTLASCPYFCFNRRA